MNRFALCLLLSLFPLFITPADAQYPPDFKKAYGAYTELVEQGKHDEAIPHARKALDIALDSDAFDDDTRAKLAFNLGYVNFQDGRMTDAAEAFGTAVELMEKAGSKNRNFMGETLVYRGICHRSLLKASEAEDDLKRALSLLNGQSPTVQLVRAEALENLAWVMIQRRLERQAQEYAGEAVEIYARLLPKSHPRTLRLRVLVAAATWLRGKRREARDLLASAIAEAEKRGIAEGTGAEAEPGQFTLRELVRFHSEVSNLYELMGREADEEYHSKVASDLAKGIRSGALSVTPVDRPPPSYPRRAARRGKIGWVIVEYTVGKDGSTSDIQIVDSAPEGFFERAAIAAVKKWKYEPPTEDGKPVEVPKVRTTIQFLLKN